MSSNNTQQTTPATGSHQNVILLIEDDDDICMLLEEYLDDQGFKVISVQDGPGGIRRFERTTPDVVLLDIMLPGLSGLEVLDRIRRTSTTPVILLTALGQEDDRVKGLDRGADDYIVKPFSPRELLARIQSLLRRSGMRQNAISNVLEFPPIELDCNFREMKIDGQKVALSDQEFETILMLARNHGRVVSRDEMSRMLLDRPAGPFDRATDIRISRLRSKISPWGECIRSVRGLGYEFVPPHQTESSARKSAGDVDPEMKLENNQEIDLK